VLQQTDVVPWQGLPRGKVRDKADLDPSCVQKVYTVHRNLTYVEKATDSNERELLAACQLLESCGQDWHGLAVTLFFDNMNAAIICKKGSPKPRLQKYAVHISELARLLKIRLNPVWIPRDLNFLADAFSNVIDFDDHAVTPAFFAHVCKTTGVFPVVDRFADNMNRKLPLFFSATYCPGTAGVNAFNYSWNIEGVNWVFPPLHMVGRALSFLKMCKGKGLFLVPQWKNTYFYPMLALEKSTPWFKGCWVFDGRGIFIQGADASSFFGPNFKANVEVWYLDYAGHD
jgi:hypothetical protein